jgi:hypothetical protein
MSVPSWTTIQFRYLRPGAVASAGGAVAAILASWALVPARSWLGNTNIALFLLLVVVVAAAFGGRTAGVVTSLAASVAFNAIHTIPYGTLVIEHRQDAITTILLAIVGIAVGELTHLRIASARRARRREYAVDRVHRIAELVQHGRPLVDVAAAVREELCAELGLSDVRLELRPPDPALPILHHSGDLEPVGGQHLPTQGVAVLVHHDAIAAGHLHLIPSPRHQASRPGLVVAVIMADLLGAALPRSSGQPASPTPQQREPGPRTTEPRAGMPRGDVG